jgi:hypothetical protein
MSTTAAPTHRPTRYSHADRVTHAHYGEGTIIDVNEYHTRIDFDEHGLRTFSSPRVELTRSVSLAPVRAKAKRTRAPKKTA